MASILEMIEFLQGAGSLDDIEEPEDKYNEWRIIWDLGVFGESGRGGSLRNALEEAVKHVRVVLKNPEKYRV